MIVALGALLLSIQSPPASADNLSSVSGESADGTVQLRPAIQAPSSSSDAQSGNPGTAPSQPMGGAAGAVNSDFDEHTIKLRAQRNSIPPVAPTSASGERSDVVLGTPPGAVTGPSAGTSKPSSREEITLERPPLKALVSINDYLSPFTLDAKGAQSLNLRDALRLGLDQNLDLAISRTVTKQRQFGYYSALGNFLPDPVLGYSLYLLNGRVTFPFNPLSNVKIPGVTTISNSGTNTVKVDGPFTIMHGGFQYYAYRGGSIWFGALQARHNYRAGGQQERATLSDTLLAVTQNYYNLVLSEALLEIRVQAVRTSEEQLRQNTDRFQDGLATNLDVLQSKTQLARDRQALVDQQIARRSAAIALATSLNVDLGTDFLPVDQTVKKVRLIDPRLSIADLLQIAIDYRPELKQYEEQRLAAKRAIIVAGAKLQPNVTLGGNIYGIGTASVITPLWVFNVAANWQPHGAGTVDSFAIQQARWQARQAALQSQKELQTVLGQVRNSLLQSLDKERNVEEASAEVSSAVEELRLAELRKAHGLGTNLDVVTGQRDYTQALIDKAQAIINFNIAQAQLLHDVGLTSVDGLTSGRWLSKQKL
jgi:outer membrane protein TolC